MILLRLAALASPPAPPELVRAREVAALRAALSHELARPLYQWRGPAPAFSSPSWWRTGWLHRVLLALWRGIVALAHSLADWISRLLRDVFGRGSAHVQGSRGSIAPWGWALIVAVALLILALLWLASRRRPIRRVAAAHAAAAAPINWDSALPSDRGREEWLRLAQDLAAAGDFRRALRAAFLGGLAALAAAQLITPRRDRTNLEYQREFARRWRRRAPPAPAPADPLPAQQPDDATGLFAALVAAFDQSWYGGRGVDRELLDEFLARQRRLLALAAPADPPPPRSLATEATA